MNLTFAAVTLPTWLFVSQWILLFALGFLIIVMYRQLALVERLKDSNSEREGLPIGEKAPAFEYTPVNRSTDAPTRFEPKGKWSLLLFADPGCASCQTTLIALERLAPKLERTMQVLVATSAEPAQIAAADAFRTSSIEIGRVRNDLSSRLYRTNITPFGYLIDPEGLIRAKGVTGDESSLRKLMRQGDRKAVNVEFTVS